MDNNNNKGVSPIVWGGLVLGLIVIIGLFIALNGTPGKNPEVTPTATETATSTPVASRTPTPTQTSTPSKTANWRTFDSALLALKFLYPNDYILKSQGFDNTGFYSALIVGDNKDEITLKVVNDALVDETGGEPRLQGSVVNFGGKDGFLFNTREGVCDVANARVKFDSTYSIRMTFKSCGPAQTLFSDKEKVKTILGSVKFGNVNTSLEVLSRQNIAFRYPIVEKLTKSLSESPAGANYIYNIGSNLTVTTGAVYSTKNAKGLTIDEILASKTGVVETIKVGGKTAKKITITPRSGAPIREVYVENKSETDLVVFKSTALDQSVLETVLGSFTFIK